MTKLGGLAASYAPRATASVVGLSMMALSSGAAFFGFGAVPALALPSIGSCGTVFTANVTINCSGNKNFGISYSGLRGATVNLTDSGMRVSGGIALTSSGGNSLTLNATSFQDIYGTVALTSDGVTAINVSGGALHPPTLFGFSLPGGGISMTLTERSNTDHSGTVTLTDTSVDYIPPLFGSGSAISISGEAVGSDMKAVLTRTDVTVNGANAHGIYLSGTASDLTGAVELNDSSIDIDGNNGVGIEVDVDQDASVNLTDGSLVDITASSLFSSSATGVLSQSSEGIAETKIAGGSVVSAKASSVVTLGSEVAAQASAVENRAPDGNAILTVSEGSQLSSVASNLLGNATSYGSTNVSGNSNAWTVINDGGVSAMATGSARAVSIAISNTTAEGLASLSIDAASTIVSSATSETSLPLITAEEAVAVGAINSSDLGDAEAGVAGGSTISATAEGVARPDPDGFAADATALVNTTLSGAARLSVDTASGLSAKATSVDDNARALGASNSTSSGLAVTAIDGGSTVDADAIGDLGAEAVAVRNASESGNAGADFNGASTISATASSDNGTATATAGSNHATAGDAMSRVIAGSKLSAEADGAKAFANGLLNTTDAGQAGLLLDTGGMVDVTATGSANYAVASALENRASDGAQAKILGGSSVDASATGNMRAGLGGFAASSTALINETDTGMAQLLIDQASGLSADATSTTDNARAIGANNFTNSGGAMVLVDRASKVSVDASGEMGASATAIRNDTGSGDAGLDISGASSVDAKASSNSASATAYGVMNGAIDGEAIARVLDGSDLAATADGTSAYAFGLSNTLIGTGTAGVAVDAMSTVGAKAYGDSTATARALQNTVSSGDGSAMVELSGKLSADAEAAGNVIASGVRNIADQGDAKVKLTDAGRASAVATSTGDLATATAVINESNGGDAIVTVAASTLSAEADGVTAGASAVSNTAYGDGLAGFALDEASTLNVKASGLSSAEAGGALNIATDPAGAASAVLDGMITISAEADGSALAGGVLNSAIDGAATMTIGGTSVIAINAFGGDDGEAIGVRNVSETGQSNLALAKGARIATLAQSDSDAAAYGVESGSRSGAATMTVGGFVSAKATVGNGDAEAIALSGETETGSTAVTLASTGSVVASVSATDGDIGSFGVRAAADAGSASVQAEAGSQVEARVSGGQSVVVIGLGSMTDEGSASVVTAADIVVDATNSDPNADIKVGGAVAQANNGGSATVTMTGGSVTSTSSIPGSAFGLVTYTRGAGATYAVNAMGGTVLADIAINTDSEAGNTGTIVIGPDAVVTSSGGHDGKALVDTDGTVTVTTTGTVVGSAWLGAGDDAFNLAGGSWTGDIHGEDGNDAFTWTGGDLNSGFYGGAGDDTAYVDGGANYEGTEIFDGGDGNDALTFDSLSATTDGSTIANWETFTVNNTMLTVTGGAITVGSTSVATDGIYLNGSTLQVNESTTFNGNLFLYPGSTLSAVDGTTGDAMTVAGNLTGGGTLAIDVDLHNALADSLTVNGAYLGGVTTLSLNELSNGYANGKAIEIIDLAGGETGKFVLPGYNVSGAYAYDLQERGNQYFLVGDFSNATPVYEVLPQLMLSLNRPDSLSDRVGDRYWNLGESGDPGYVWADIRGGREHYESTDSTLGVNYDADVMRLRMGVDAQFADNDSGFVVGGLVFQYASATADVSSRVGGGDLDSQLFGIGGTLTWYGNNGLYVDGQAFANMLGNDITVAGAPSVDMNTSFGYSLSAETGYRIDLASGWALTPQAQLTYGSVNFDNFSGVYDEDVSLIDGDSLAIRMGLQSDRGKSWTTAFGEKRSASFHGIANVYYELLDDPSKVRVSGVDMVTDDGDWTGEVGIGGTYTWLDGKLGINGDLTASTGLENFGDSYSLTGKVRFQMKW